MFRFISTSMHAFIYAYIRQTMKHSREYRFSSQKERIYSASLGSPSLGYRVVNVWARSPRDLSTYKPHGTYVCTCMCMWRQMCLVIFYAGRSQAPIRSRNIALSATTSLFLSLFSLSYRSCSFSRSPSFARRDIGTEYRVSIAATIIASLCATSRWCRRRQVATILKFSWS